MQDRPPTTASHTCRTPGLRHQTFFPPSSTPLNAGGTKCEQAANENKTAMQRIDKKYSAVTAALLVAAA